MQHKDNKLNYVELAVLAMQRVNKPMTVSELWQYVQQNNLHCRLKSFDDKTQKLNGNTPQATFGARIVTNRQIFAEVPNTKPKQYVLKDGNILAYNQDSESENGKNIAKANSDTKITKSIHKFHERDLHPVLSHFLKNNAYFKAYSKTIFHETSQKNTRGADKWLYPDMVAVDFEYANYQKNNVLKFIQKFDILPIKIFSFEIKKELNFSNYKESFFQAVSNCSWANEGYLVAVKIQQDNQFIEALQKLSQSFGIGIIELSLYDITKSKVLSPAKFKEKMDYTVIDELANKNPNFAQFLKTVTDFEPSNPNRFLNEFDKVLSIDDLNKYLKHNLKNIE